MSSDHHVYDAIMADMWLKGEAKTISVFEKLGLSRQYGTGTKTEI